MTTRMLPLLGSLAAMLLCAAACAGHAIADDTPGDAKPFGLDKRVEWTTSRLVGSPEPPLPYTVEPVFAKRTWKSPIYVADEPGSDCLWVISQSADGERPNQIQRIQSDGAAGGDELLLVLPDRLIYAVCFDPDYAKNRYVYTFSNRPGAESKKFNRVSRYTAEIGPPTRLDPTSEQVILEWRSEGHDGGDLVFGLDGMLYIAAGDGTGDSDTWNTGQTLDDLLGAVLRIDVTRGEGDRPYAIPADNPFVDLADARGEIWAYGLRNPWRLAVDRTSGHLWVGNNGQDLWETAHLVRRGDNFGWSVYEGSHPFYPLRRPGPTPHVPPTIEHSHAEFRSLTGGVVYHGDKLPELVGAYVYGDYSTGRIWGMKHDGTRVLWHRELADTALGLAAFRVDQHGELLIVDHGGGGIYRLVPAPKTEQPAPFPTLLSETGLFQSTRHHQPADGLISYSVNAPAWADGADAERYIAVPGTLKIDYASPGNWTFPDGTALVQTLSLPTRLGNPATAGRVETRVMLKQQGEWVGYSYRWNAEQTDAALVPKEGADAAVVVSNPLTATAHEQAWRFPSRAECLACHSRAANFALGLSESQLNRPHNYGGVVDNQLRTLAHIEMFSNQPDKPPDQLAKLVDPYDPQQDLDARVRAYLHVNCSVCHVSAGGGNAQMELAAIKTREEMKLISARPQHSTFGLVDAMLVAPGDPECSVLLHRLSLRGRGQMPPLVSSRVDQRAVDLLRGWIAQLKPELPIVKRWTMEDLLPALGELDAGRSPEAGQSAFRKTGCVQCHRFGEEGGTVGPDLSGVARRLKSRDMLESILLPSKVVDDRYARYAFATDDGLVVSGQIEREDEQVVVVRPDSAGDLPTEIKKQDIVGRRRLEVSNMPEGTVNVLEKEQILDLLSYLLNEKPEPADSGP